MKLYPPASAPKHRRKRRLPAFHPVPVAPRKDGWTLARQAEFIGFLAQYRSVARAARAVSMGRESAYRLRKRPGAAGFAAAWDAAIGVPLERAHPHVPRGSAKATGQSAAMRAQAGLVQVILRGGRYAGYRRIPDDTAVLQWLAQLDRTGGQATGGGVQAP